MPADEELDPWGESSGPRRDCAEVFVGNVAMLIDWENIKACATHYLKTSPDILTLKKIARRYGTLTIARAYAHWTDPSGWHTGDVERLSDQGVEPVFVWTRRESRNPGPEGQGPNYVSDMVDLRLACDCMELLAMHPEVCCYVVVSGDGALETLLAKLSAHGKRIVRVSVEKGLAVGTHVLGEERVLYDDWIKGLKMPVDAGPVQSALRTFAAAVSSLRASSADHGLQSVKEVMRRNESDFEEEKLGIPTFRHLAYLAEAKDLVRIDGRREPAQAYLPDEKLATDGTILPNGATWLQFIQTIEQGSEYIPSGLEALFETRAFADGTARDLIQLAHNSDVITKVLEHYVARDRETGQAKRMPTWKFRLNLHHPRVQVALANRSGGS
jgi:uncharacterized LabA/DUF88 family protein